MKFKPEDFARSWIEGALFDYSLKELMAEIANAKLAEWLKGQCWEWEGYIKKTGYGIIKKKNKPVFAHRLSYETFVRPIPKGLMVCHKCDNRKCIRPSHLFVGTAKDNMLDCVAKGRHYLTKRNICPKGHPYTKENTIIKKGGRRNCRACNVARTKTWKKTHKAKLVEIEEIK